MENSVDPDKLAFEEASLSGFSLPLKLDISGISWIVFKASVTKGDKCIQNYHLGRYIVSFSLNIYIVGYTDKNLVLRQRIRGVLKLTKCISDDLLPQLIILNMVIPILMY